MSRTTIEWTRGDDGSAGRTWNPVAGCSVVSPGCHRCYARDIAARFSKPGQPYHGLAVMTEHGPQWTGELRLVEKHLADPLRWGKPRRIFVNSMSDLFHEGLTNEQIASVFGVMASAPRHTFQVLTKRSRRMRDWFAWIAEQGRMLPGLVGERIPSTTSGEGSACVMLAGEKVLGAHQFILSCQHSPWPLPNVWLGVSAEDQQRADERIPDLLATPAAVRVVSYEPALGPVDFTRIGNVTPAGNSLNAFTGVIEASPWQFARLSWVIVGGESGRVARPFDLAWARTVIAQCKDAGVACFVKQLGSNPHGEWGDTNPPKVLVDGIGGGPSSVEENRFKNGRWRLRDRKGGSMSEWPSDLRVREFPRVEGSVTP